MSDLCSAFGLVLDDWQEVVLRAGMGERMNGDWAARQIGICTPRQNGKTMLIVARILAGLLLFGERTIIVSAHRQDTAREVFTRLVQLIEDNPSLEDRVDFIAKSEMREYIRMKSGQEVRFKSRLHDSGRGFSCDCLLLDEAQILGAAAWSATLPTMSARPNPQVWLFGTPPTELNDSEVFTRFREAGMAKQARLAWLEWSADDDDDVDDPATWAKSNPAYGSRITHEAVAGERATMSLEQFKLERLGIWASESKSTVIPLRQWTDLAIRDEDVPLAPASRFALTMSPERVASIAVAVQGEDADYLDLVEIGRVDDSRKLFEMLVTLCGRRTVLMIDQRDPAASFINDLRNKYNVKINVTSQSDSVKACTGFVGAVGEGRIAHCDQPAIHTALAIAQKKPVGKFGQWEWNIEDPTSEMAALRAMTLAHFGLSFKRRTGAGRSGGNNRRAVVA